MALAIMCSCTDTNNNAAVDASLVQVSDAGLPGTDAGPSPGMDGGDQPETIDVKEPGYLWFAGGALSSFVKSQMQASSNRGPSFKVVPITMVTNFHDLAFDRLGNVWVLPISGNQVLRIPNISLMNAVPPSPPDITISGMAVKSPQSVAFDASGNLWVLNYDGAGSSIASIVRYDGPGQLMGDAQPSPSLTITPAASDRGRFSQGTTIAFDAQGNLWFAGVSNVWRIDHATTMSGAVTASPSAVISSGTDAYVSIALDTAGSLWVTGAKAGYYVMRIDNPGSLTGMVNPTPAALVHLPSDKAMFAGGLGFDADGALWVAMSNQVVKLDAPRMLTGESMAAPSVTLGLSSAPDLASKVAFFPTPPGLPVY